MRYTVEQREDTHYYIVGLKEEFGPGPDTILLYHYTSEESETPDVDSPHDVHKMYGALYDLYQCHDGLKKGDVFQTPFGEFACEGIHVVPLFDMPKRPTCKHCSGRVKEATEGPHYTAVHVNPHYECQYDKLGECDVL